MSNKILQTAESVSEGHPDKLCDRIADAILDEALKQDQDSRTAVEVLATKEKIIIAGEVTTKAKINYEKIARDVTRFVGYTSPEIGIGCDTMEVINLIKEQSLDIALGVNKTKSKKTGAGDQGIMYGFATDETSNYMPLNLSIAHKIVRYASNLRRNGTLYFARPDMKSQVTIDYTESSPKINAIVFSCQTDDSLSIDQIREKLLNLVLIPVVESFKMKIESDTEIYINPTGRFVIGGPLGDTGLTGRKIIVDTYSGNAPHGGGSFSGKDPTKVDRTATYAARHACKNIVAAGLCKKCLIQLSYAIGISEPISINVETFNTETISKDKILKVLLNEKIFDFTPDSIIERFSLTHPTFRYQDLCCYGHFGRPDLDLPFEKLDKVEQIKQFIKTL